MEPGHVLGGRYTVLALGEGVLPHLVMEYVQGCTLDEMLRQGPPLPAARALELTLGVLEALERAHARGIVHRDVKPANMTVTWDGRTKVMDFGVAQFLAIDAMALTQGSVVIGTAAYLSPEQADTGAARSSRLWPTARLRRRGRPGQRRRDRRPGAVEPARATVNRAGRRPSRYFT